MATVCWMSPLVSAMTVVKGRPGLQIAGGLELVAESWSGLVGDGHGAVAVLAEGLGGGGQDDHVEVVGGVKGIGPAAVRVDRGAGEGAEKGGDVVALLSGQSEGLHAAGAAQAIVQIGVVSRDGGVVIDHLSEAGEAAVMHEGAVEQTCGVHQITQRRRAGVGEIGAAADGRDDAVVEAVGINVKLRWPVAARATRTALGRRAEVEAFAVVLLVGVVGKRIGIGGHLSATDVILGVKRLNAADELREGTLHTAFCDGGVAKRHGEQHPILRDSRQLHHQIRKRWITLRAAEAHLHVILDGLGGLGLQIDGPFIPEELPLCCEARVDEPHRVAARRATHACTGRRGIAEAILLLVTGRTGDGVVARKPFVVEQHPAQGGSDVRDDVPPEACCSA